MLKHTLFFLFLLSSYVHAQDLPADLKFIENQSMQLDPVGMPLYVDLEGNLNILSNESFAPATISPLGNLGFRNSTEIYARPIQQEGFSLSLKNDDANWIEVKRKYWEVGAGIGAMVAQSFALGLAPYKGARNLMIRQKKFLAEKTPSPKLPEELDEIQSWQVGDKGSFQRYGGVQVHAGLKFSVLNAFSVALTLQSLFNISIEKIDDQKIKFTITEESLKRRRIQTGTPLVNASLNLYKGRRLVAYFILNLNDSTHKELFKDGIKGKLTSLQRNLPEEAQKMEWQGTEKSFYMGIPLVAGKFTRNMKLKMVMGEEVERIDIKAKENVGGLIPRRIHQHMLQIDNSSLMLFWFSEMFKADGDVFTRKVLTPGRLMGARGFETYLPKKEKIGTSTFQMGLSFNRDEIEMVLSNSTDEILENFRGRCYQLSLNCFEEKRFNIISRNLKSIKESEWEVMSTDLGHLLIKEPALIHSFLRAMNIQKKVNFILMSKKYQSVEGSALIEI